MFLLNSIRLASWGWLQAQSNSILGLFEFHFTCFCLFHRIFRAIQDEVRQAFRLPFNQIAQDPTDELTWYLFFLLPHWCLHYIRDGCSSQWEVSACLKRFLVGNWFSFQKESSHASYGPHSFHSQEDFSTTHFHQCLTLGRFDEYSYATKVLQPMTLIIPSKDNIAALHQLHPFPLDLVPPPMFDY